MNHPPLEKMTKELELLQPQRATAALVDQVGTGVNVAGGNGEAIAILAANFTGGTSPSLAVKLQESDVVGGTYTDISGGALTTLTADGITRLAVKMTGRNKFIRASWTSAGTSITIDFCCILVVGGYTNLVSGGATF